MANPKVTVNLDCDQLGTALGTALAASFDERWFEKVGQALSKAADTKKEKSTAERFPKRDIFADIYRLPRALQEYKEWCAEKKIKDAEAITDLKLLLPQQLRDYRASGVQAQPLRTWDEAEKVLLTEAACYLGEVSIQEKMDGIKYDASQRVTDLWAELLCLSRLKNSNNQDQAKLAAMEELRARLPREATSRVESRVTQIADLPRVLASLQREVDALRTRSGSNTANVYAVASEKPVSFECEGTPFRFVLDTGADISFVSVDSRLGKLLGRKASPTHTLTHISTPGGKAKVAWSATADISVKHPTLTEEGKLSTTVVGVEGLRSEAMFLGRPSLANWGVTYDAGTSRFGIKSLKSKSGTPWFAIPADLPPTEMQSVNHPQNRDDSSRGPTETTPRRFWTQGNPATPGRGPRHSALPVDPRKAAWKTPGNHNRKTRNERGCRPIPSQRRQEQQPKQQKRPREAS